LLAGGKLSDYDVIQQKLQGQKKVF